MTASKRGYTTAAYDEHEDFSSAVVTGEGQDTAHLVFRILPGAVLRGVVTADGGDPVEGAEVMLFEKPQGHKPGGKITQVDSTTTDDTGAYEFVNLAKGEYLLAVKAEPWYAMHHEGGGAHGRQSEGTNPVLDVAYPITYFDSTTDEASAALIVLAGGSREEANINLHAAPALHLAVQTPRKEDGTIIRPELRQTIFGAAVSTQSAGFMDSIQTGSTEFARVAPGHYQLTQGDPPRVVDMDATTSQEVDPAAGTPAAPVNGTLQIATGVPLPGDPVVTLEPADGAQTQKPMESSSSHGAFSFPPVPAGTWALKAEESGMQLQIVSIAGGGQTRPGNRFVVKDRPLSLVVVTVNEGAVQVKGFVVRDGKGVAGVMVVLVPKDRAVFPGPAFPVLVRRDQSDTDGSFNLRNVVPGRYTVVAIEDGWVLDWSHADVIGRYLPGGIGVTVTATTDKIVRLSAPVPVQQR